MARTYAQAFAEMRRLMNTNKRVVARIIKNPLLGDDGAIYPGGPGTNDYLVQVKDPRPVSTTNAGNESSAIGQATAISTGTWHNAASTNEHYIRIRGLCPNASLFQNTAGWHLYGAGETREAAGFIPDSTVIFA